MQTVRAANPAKRFPKAIKGGSRPTKSSQAKAGDKPFDFTFAVSTNSSKNGKEAPSMDELRAAVRRLSVSENSKFWLILRIILRVDGFSVNVSISGSDLFFLLSFFFSSPRPKR